MQLPRKLSFLESFTHSLTRAAFLVGIFSFIASLLGMVRDRMLAGTFGAGADLDTYYAAFRLPDFFYNTLLIGITSSAFLPVLTRYLHKPGKEKTGKGKEEEKPLAFPQEAKNFIDSLITFMFAVLFFSTLVLFFATPVAMNWIAPGFNLEQKTSTIMLTRIMLLSPIFLSFSGMMGNILNLKKFFFFYSLAPIVYNLAMILSIVFLVPRIGVQGLAWGIALGALCHLSVQLLPAKALGFEFSWRWEPNHPGIKKVFKIAVPRSIHLGVLQFNLVITTLLASTLPAGSLAVFNFANNLQSVPLGLFGASYAIAAFPALSIMVAKKERKKFRDEFVKTMCQILFFIIPLSAILIILRAQVVRLILGSGKFDWEDTVLTLNVLGILAVSLFAQSLNLLFIRAFFALQDTITPLKSGIIGLVVNTVIGALVVKNWNCFAPFIERQTECSGFKAPIIGLAFAFSVSQVASFIFLLVGLSKHLKGISIGKIKLRLSKIALATLGMGAATQTAKWLFGEIIVKKWSLGETIFSFSTIFSVFSQIVFSGIIGIVVYLFICKTLRCEELTSLYEECPKIFGRKYCPTKKN